MQYRWSDRNYPEGEKSIDMTVAAKGIRLDVYVENAERTMVYNIEMQTTLNSSELKNVFRFMRGNGSMLFLRV